MDRYIYFIQAEITKRIKIGIAWNPIKRIKLLQIGSPDRLSLVLAFLTKHSALTTERHLHHLFQEHRLHGEWFEAAPELVAFIETYKKAADNLPADQEIVYESKKPTTPVKQTFIGPLSERPRSYELNPSERKERKKQRSVNRISKEKRKELAQQRKAKRLVKNEADRAKRKANARVSIENAKARREETKARRKAKAQNLIAKRLQALENKGNLGIDKGSQ